MRTCARGVALCLLAAGAWTSGAPLRETSLLDILAEELNRNFSILRQNASPKPYFLAYAVTETESHSMRASLGALEGDTETRSRALDVTVRVGNPDFDNYRVIQGQRPRFTRGVPIAIENNPNAIKQALWRETHEVYRRAAQRFIQLQTDQQVAIEREEAPPDFSSEEPARFTGDTPAEEFARAGWQSRLRKLSAALLPFRTLQASQVSLRVQRQTKYLVSSEETRIRHGQAHARLQVVASARAPDGMNLVNTISFEAEGSSGLPPDEEMIAAIEEMAGELTAMVNAPPASPYVGPAILSGEAAGVFFHEIFGHRVEGHRLRDIRQDQTFGDRVGSSVLPGFLSVVFDPAIDRLAGQFLMGAYAYDDEGIPARRVNVVEDGIMKTFLMSRSPVPGIAHSNGHGRRAPGREVMSRQSNLIVTASETVTEDALRQLLAGEIRRQNKEYGFYFKRVTGGFTLTGRSDVQAFKVIPLVVYRVYADGRTDELVRGADIVGTPLAAFAKIVAAGDTPRVFNGYCGAESGNVPVSAVSPALLVSEIEIQRKESSEERPPLLPRPYQAEVTQ